MKKKSYLELKNSAKSTECTECSICLMEYDDNDECV